MKENKKNIFTGGMESVYDHAQTREMFIFQQRVILSLLALTGILGVGIATLVPLKQYIPIYTQFFTDEDIYFTTIKPADLTFDQQRHFIRKELRDYTVMRETIDNVAATNIRAKKIKALSTKSVFAQFVQDVRKVYQLDETFEREVYVISDQALHYAQPKSGKKGTQLVRFHVTDKQGKNTRKGAYVATIKYGYSKAKQNREGVENNVWNLQIYSYTLDVDELNETENTLPNTENILFTEPTQE